MSNKQDLPPLAYMRAEANPFNGYAACHAQDHRAFPVVRLDDALAAIQRLEAENANLRSVMVAAAEEIAAHWAAHCDDEGYGPANLMRRLEEGIPTEYAYTAGDFARLKAENEALKRVVGAARAVADGSEYLGEDFWAPSHLMAPLSLALDELDAMTKEQKT